MPAMPTFMSRVTDTNSGLGKIIRGAKTVYCGGLPVALGPSPITPHPGSKICKSGGTAKSSIPNIFCEGSPILRVTDLCTCGHVIAKGDKTVIVS